MSQPSRWRQDDLAAAQRRAAAGEQPAPARRRDPMTGERQDRRPSGIGSPAQARSRSTAAARPPTPRRATARGRSRAGRVLSVGTRRVQPDRAPDRPAAHQHVAVPVAGQQAPPGPQHPPGDLAAEPRPVVAVPVLPDASVTSARRTDRAGSTIGGRRLPRGTQHEQLGRCRRRLPMSIEGTYAAALDHQAVAAPGDLVDLDVRVELAPLRPEHLRRDRQRPVLPRTAGRRSACRAPAPSAASGPVLRPATGVARPARPGGPRRSGSRPACGSAGRSAVTRVLTCRR